MNTIKSHDVAKEKYPWDVEIKVRYLGERSPMTLIHGKSMM
jgi:hypothetical protein